MMTAEVPMTDNPHVGDHIPPQVPFSLDSLTSRMKQGTRVIRVVESGDQQCIDMCMLKLSPDEKRVFIVDEYMNTVSLEVGSFVKVARSNMDEHAIALLIPSTSEILQFIFSSEEELHLWFTGFRSLRARDDSFQAQACSSRASTPDTAHSEDCCDETVNITRGRLGYHDTICDLIEIISELRDQNDSLIRSRKLYEDATMVLANELEISQMKLFSVMEENARLRVRVNSCDSGLLNMAELLIFILKDSGKEETPRSRRASLASVDTNIRPHDCVTNHFE
jgi:hypothetical protein